jgi:anaerobic glycerol-3-phosphate dehydrogenase
MAMTITPKGFESGAQFLIKASTEAERILLLACVGSEPDSLYSLETETESEDNEFILTMPVSNG